MSVYTLHADPELTDSGITEMMKQDGII